MKYLLVFLVSLIVIAPCYGEYYARIDTDTGDVIAIWQTPLYEEGVLVDETLKSSHTVEITQSEYETGVLQTTIDTAVAQGTDDAKDFEKQFSKLLKAFALVVKDEINILRANDGLADRTTAQLKTAVKNKYDTL